MGPLSTTVTVDVVLGTDVESLASTTLRVRVEDVSYAGMCSRPIHEHVVPAVDHRSGQEKRVRVTLHVDGFDERARYVVSAHLAVHNGAEIRPGDYITMQSYPVLTFGHPRHVEVRLRKV